MALILYNLLLPFLVLTLLPGYLRRMVKRGNFRRNFGQRVSWFRRDQLQRLKARTDWVWVRAVSVGEMVAAEKIIRQWKAESPGLAVVVSTTTATGYAVAEQRFADAQGDWIEIIYSPLDFPFLVWRALNVIRPRAIVFIESEIWPNLAWLAHSRGIRLALANSRMSPRSEARFRRFGHLGRSIFRLLDLVTIQEEEHRAVWQQMGVPTERIRLTGALKLDFSAADLEKARATGEFHQLVENTLGWLPDDPVLMGGSTAPGEEMILAQIFQNLKNRYPRLKLLLAPRHVERAPEILQELKGLGLAAVRRKKLSGTATREGEGDVLLLDTTGELARWYAVATLVFIGKSLTVPGGQNPVEALAAGRPVLFGPHMENQQWITRQMLEADAAIEVQSGEELHEKIEKLLADESARKKLIDHGDALLERVCGAARNNTENLRQLFSE